MLTAYNLNILGSHVYSTRTGLALEIYRLTTPRGGDAERRLAWSAMVDSLDQVLTERLDVAALLRRRGRPVGLDVAPRRQPASVSVSNEESDFYTIVDVTANDRLGLLHDLTRVIADHGFEIYISKAATIMDQVADTFYLKDDKGRKLREPDAIERLCASLRDAANREEVGRGG